jgi:hypothetical protein
MRITTILCASALILTQPAYAIEQPLPPIIIEQPQPEPQPVPTPTPETPPERESSGGGVDILGVAVVVGGLLLLNHLSKNSQPDLSEPRPQVRPEGCLNKYGEVVACSF